MTLLLSPTYLKFLCSFFQTFKEQNTFVTGNDIAHSLSSSLVFKVLRWNSKFCAGIQSFVFLIRNLLLFSDQIVWFCAIYRLHLRHSQPWSMTIFIERTRKLLVDSDFLGLWFVFLNGYFQFLNCISCIFINFFINMYFYKCFQTIIFNF